MTTRREALLSISGCAGMLAMPIASSSRQSSFNFEDVINEIQQLGNQMVANRYEIFKQKGVEFYKIDHTEREEIAAEIADMIAEKLKIDIWKPIFDFTKAYPYETYWMGDYQLIRFCFFFKMHSNDVINNYSKET